jgi:hypothetical protein
MSPYAEPYVTGRHDYAESVESSSADDEWLQGRGPRGLPSEPFAARAPASAAGAIRARDEFEEVLEASLGAGKLIEFI